MEVLSNNPLTLSEILNESSMLDLSIDDASAIELQLLPEKLGDSDDEYYAVIQMFFNNHPYFRGIGSEYYDFDLLTDTRRESLSKYLKWLINSINSWSGDKANSNFSALCQLIRVFNWGDDFWDLLNSKGFQNDKWLDACYQVLQATTPQVQPARFSHNPISFENENKIFMSSEKEQDWDGVARFLNTSELNFYPPVLKESLRCLYALDFHKLIEICNSVDTALVALVYSQCLSRSEALHVAETTTSPYIRFVFVYTNIRKGVQPHEEGILFNVFYSVSQSENEWCKWLKVFNRYPVRFPQLQKILGAVIAKGSRSAIQAYFSSLHLHTQPSQERELVSECLSVFQSLAPESERVYAWRVAYDRWVEWDFDASNEKSLMEISQSAIDFAVVGFFVEVEPEHIKNATEKLVKKLNVILDEWHESSVSLITEQNKAFSFFQPLIHAKVVIEQSVDWYYPPEHRYKIDFGNEWRRYMELMGLG